VGGLCVCAGGLDIENLIKTPMIHNAPYFDLGELGTLFGEAKPTKAPPWRRDCEESSMREKGLS